LLLEKLTTGLMVSNDTEKKIISLLSKQLMSTSQLAKKLKMRREVVAGYLEALKNQGKLKKTRVGRSNVYRPVKK